MTLSAAIRQRLVAAPLITVPAGQIGTSGHLRAVPAITVQVVADPRPQHFKGFQPVRSTAVQIDVWASDEATAAAICGAVIAVLIAADATTEIRFQRAQVTNIRSGPERQQQSPGQRIQAELYRESIDFIFTHNAN